MLEDGQERQHVTLSMKRMLEGKGFPLREGRLEFCADVNNVHIKAETQTPQADVVAWLNPHRTGPSYWILCVSAKNSTMRCLE